MSIGRIMTLAEKLSREELDAMAYLMKNIGGIGHERRKEVLALFPALKGLGIDDIGAIDAMVFVIGKIASAPVVGMAPCQEPRAVQPGCVYVVRAEGTDAVKVGFSRDVKSRIASLQTASAFPLKLLGHFVGLEESHERAVHARLSSRRMSGEWFSFAQDEDPCWVVEYLLNEVGA